MNSGTITKIWVSLILLSSYILFKLPILHIPILFYDDGEMMYHAFALSKGLIPYLDTHSHHFLGYILPIILSGKLFGFSPDLLRQMGAIFQVLTGLGIFILVNRFTSKGWSLFAAILYISAREPWVNGFPIQYELNLLIVLILLLIDKKDFTSAAAIASLGFIFDQRALALITLPLAAITATELKLKPVLKFLTIYSILPLLTLLWLYTNGALLAFWEQTFIFPSKYRVATLSFWDSIAQGFSLHRYLLTSTPWLFGLALAGYAALFDLRIKDALSPELRRALLIAPLILFAMAGIGGRDYDYYTVIWLPVLSALAGVCFYYAVTASSSFKLSVAFMTIIGIFIPHLYSLALLKTDNFKDYGSDGSVETASFIKANMKPNDSVFVWGYRMDLYLRIGKTAPFADASLLFIHPDAAIKNSRWRHIAPKYEYDFMEKITANMPTFLVRFTRGGDKTLFSPSKELVSKLININYQKVFEIERKDYQDGYPKFEVYKLNSDYLPR